MIIPIMIDGKSGYCVYLKEREDFSEFVKEVRERLGCSQMGLAALLGNKQATISNWEQGIGVPTFNTITRLAKLVETPILIGW